MASALTQEIYWKTQGPYISTLASKASILEETRLFLVTYGQTNDVEATTQILLHNVLAQRSRSTRNTIIKILKLRLTRWNPPAWVTKDLVTFASESNLDALRAALLLHVPRQDHVLYDFAQQVIVPHQEKGEMRVFISDVQTFFDASQNEHPEVLGWSFATRLRESQGILATLRDYCLLKGEVNKYIAIPMCHLLNFLSYLFRHRKTYFSLFDVR